MNQVVASAQQLQPSKPANLARSAQTPSTPVTHPTKCCIVIQVQNFVYTGTGVYISQIYSMQLTPMNGVSLFSSTIDAAFSQK